jgi:hypothetical protein
MAHRRAGEREPADQQYGRADLHVCPFFWYVDRAAMAARNPGLRLPETP